MPLEKTGPRLSPTCVEFLLTLTVPRVLVEEMAGRYGTEVWRAVVQNVRMGKLAARGATELARHGGYLNHWALLLGSQGGVNEATQVVISRSDIPDWLMYHVLRHVGHIPQHIVTGAEGRHSKELQWWLHDWSVAGGENALEGFVTRDMAQWTRAELARLTWEAAGREASLEWQRYGELPVREVLEGAAKTHSQVLSLLGKGYGTVSLSRWRKLMDLAESGVRGNVVDMARSVVLIEGARKK